MPTFPQHLAEALDLAGLTPLDVFHRGGIRPERVRQLGLGEGLPVSLAEASALGDLLLVEPQEVIGWCATPASGPLREHLVHLAFHGVVGPERRLSMHSPPTVATSKAFAEGAAGFAIIDTPEMTGAGIELGSRVAVVPASPATLREGAIVLAHAPEGAFCRRLRQADEVALLVAEPGGRAPAPLPLQIDGDRVRILAVVIRVRRPDLTV